jgi:hypothetical protein
MNEIKNPISDRVNPRILRSEPLQRCVLHECKGACCVFGVWVDRREVDDILANAALILPSMPENAKVPGEWFVPVEDDDIHSPSGKVIHTAVENNLEHYGGTACIFLREDAKCALQVAGAENHLHPWRFKPFYCILHPLDLDEEGRITVDEVETLVSEPGSCLQSADHPIPLTVTFEEELSYLLGDKGFKSLLDSVKK